MRAGAASASDIRPSLMTIARKGRCFSVPQVREDQAEIFPRRIAPCANLCRERFFFGRLLRALTFRVETPAVIHAADRVAFDPPGGKLRAAVRAAKIHDVRRPAVPAVKGKALAHDLNGFGLSWWKLFRPINRMPKPSHKLAGESSGASGNEIFMPEFFMSAGRFAFPSGHAFSPKCSLIQLI